MLDEVEIRISNADAIRAFEEYLKRHFTGVQFEVRSIQVQKTEKGDGQFVLSLSPARPPAAPAPPSQPVT